MSRHSLLECLDLVSREVAVGHEYLVRLPAFIFETGLHVVFNHLARRVDLIHLLAENFDPLLEIFELYLSLRRLL